MSTPRFPGTVGSVARTAGTADDVRPMRADARRNRQRILDAAAATFAAEGIAVPVDVVAERAGVGVGTLYRHFPTKEALFEAIVMDRIDTLLCAAAPNNEASPADVLFGFLATMAAEVSAKHDLFDALAQAGVDLKERCSEKFDELTRAINTLRLRAVADGTVRADVSTEEILSLVVGVCAGSGKAPGACSTQALVGVVCDGLRARH